MQITVIPRWSLWGFWSGSEEALQGKPIKHVPNVALVRSTQQIKKRVSPTVAKSTFSPLRLLLLTQLFWAVCGQGLGPYPAVFNLSTLNGANGFALPGEVAGDHSGRSVSSAGDLNGDGLSDVVIGAYLADPSGKNNAGKSHVLFGSHIAIPGGIFNLSTLNGSNGFTIPGKASSETLGNSVSSAGDVNGDGLTDLVIGAIYAFSLGKNRAGKSYVLFGSRTPIPGGLLDISNLNGSNGFIILGENARDQSGKSVSSAGDVNGDGLSDLVIGADQDSSSGNSLPGKSYVIFGSRTPIPGGLFDLSTLNGTNGFVILGETDGDSSGASVCSAGDVNGDGLSDLVIGAFKASPSGKSRAGKSYVFFGNRTPIPGGVFNLTTLNGSNGFTIPGEAAGDSCGVSVSSAGDVNGDGLSDLVIGAHGASLPGKPKAGKSYVIFGSRTLIPGGVFNLSTLNGANGFTIPGEVSYDTSGFSVSSAGDVNRDGLADLLIGGWHASPLGRIQAGKVHVIFGNPIPIPGGVFDLSTLNGSNGFTIPGEAANDFLGCSVSSAGDVNGDGYADLMIGAYGFGPSSNNYAGKSYIIFGGNRMHDTPPVSIQSSQFSSTSPISSLPPLAQGNSSLSNSFSTDSSKILATTIDLTSTIHTSRMQPPNTATSSFVVVDSSPSSSPLLIGGIVALVTAFACSLFGGILFYLKKRSASNDKVQGTALSSTQPDPAVPAGYVDFRFLQQDIRSAGLGGDYAIISVTKKNDHYDQLPSESVPKGTGHYHKGGLEELNQKMDEYLSTKDVV